MNNLDKNTVQLDDNTDVTIQIPNYQINQIVYAGSRTLVYRAIRIADGLPVIIKLMKRQYPTFSELVQFRNQYSIAKNLDIAGIAKPYSLEPYHNGYALVMEDFGGISLEKFTQKNPLSLDEFLQIALSLTDIVHCIHQQRVIHKDIKPANILIHPDTKQVKLIDFSISSLLSRETQQIQNPNALEGTLAYLSPEQTGRMNRGIDYRSDYYSLGITWYELLTGNLPFKSNDPMELVHCHIAKQPDGFHREEIPQVLVDMVMKLMAKNAEERYQSTLGIKNDLEKCLVQLQETGKIENFPIAQRDLSDRFIIPDKLYGRETEIETLLQAFERVSLGTTEMMLVAGFSGIGKTAVINEVHKPIVKQRGYFIKGKFDQFQRNIPFSAFVQAFRDLMEQLLTECDDLIHQLKHKILEAVGENGQVIIEVIPELSRIIGEQTPAIELSGTAAENRFNLLFQKFTQVFTSASHPLVMFLDDLQWADSASLKLMQLLMADTSHLFIIGAYRNNEVNPGHPLMLTLSDIQKTQATINTITLAPLTQEQVNKLVADTLKCSENLAGSISQLIYQKTKGNPFFVVQFLKALHQDGLINFDFELGCWQCDVTQVTTQAVTDDVVTFMGFQLQKLPQSTQDLLELAACIGNSFDLATLAIVSQQSELETASALWKALQEGLILPIGDVYKFYIGQENQARISENQLIVKYKFLHDRVQQAAYSLIPDERKQETHLKIGRLLLQNFSETEEKIFDIVGHFNRGADCLAQLQERQTLAQLNLAAGRKARNSTAYTAARVYLQTGLELLAVNCWKSQYELTLNLYVAAAEVAYLNSDFEGMERMTELVLQKARTILDKVEIYEILIVAQTAKGNVLEAIAIGRKALQQLGFELPGEADAASTDRALQTLVTQLQDKQIEELVDLPAMSDAHARAAMQLLGKLFAPIFLGRPSLLPLLSSMMVNLSLQFGNTSASTVGYAIHGLVLCAFLEEVETGYQFGKLSIELLERLNVRELKTTILAFFGSFIQPQKEAWRATIPTLKESYIAGRETGDFLQAAYSILCYFHHNLLGGIELSILEAEIPVYMAVLTQSKQYIVRNYTSIVWQTVQNFREIGTGSDCLIGNVYDETVMLPKHEQDKDFTAIAIAYIYKLLLAYFFGNYTAALNYSTQAQQYLMALSGMIFVPIFHFYSALTQLALCPTQPETERAEVLNRVETEQAILHHWVQNAPTNHLHRWYLVEAERHRVLDEKIAAIECYDRAISLAKDNQFINEEALANELFAKFYLDWGKEKVAQVYMQEAYYCYARWGAVTKSIDLEQRYPQLLAPILQQVRSPLNYCETLIATTTISPSHSSAGNSRTSTSSGFSAALDLTTLFKAYQTLSSEIELEKLFSTLLHIAIENAGADRGALLLLKEDRLFVEAMMSLEQQPNLLRSLPVEETQELPISLINIVKRTLRPTAIANVMVHPLLLAEPYIIRQQPKSLLCMPILHQGKLLGILYLENHLVTGAFTSDRIEILNLLSTQAAISLENARLYQQAQDALAHLEEMQLQLVQSEKMSALGNLVTGVAHEINNPLGFIASNLKPAQEYVQDLFGLIDLFQQKLTPYDAEIEEEIEAIELEYLREDLPKLIESMNLGVERIHDISTSLRTFARADKDYKVSFNIHEGIDSTILILKHRLKANENRPAIKIVKEYGNLPPINCFPGQLNQVFMNILANAIDALEESNQGRSFSEIKVSPNRITIRTRMTNEKCVTIGISDNGIGMTEEVKQQIFDRLFTTKAVGRGTGLGMAIAKSIVVEQHGGSIQVNSILGSGTEFIITLPTRADKNS
ncbi:AAA family ATPase [Microcoleus sp. Pol14C6]|uniref:AAA family ATPase n=1 Tax=unclassified Microcoleus TaxID=2642155 RepID=UPI002FD31710